jgi:hypothetical protein
VVEGRVNRVVEVVVVPVAANPRRIRRVDVGERRHRGHEQRHENDEPSEDHHDAVEYPTSAGGDPRLFVAATAEGLTT